MSSSLPKQLKAAISELKQVARKQPALAVNGVLQLLVQLKQQRQNPPELGADQEAKEAALVELVGWLPSAIQRAKPDESTRNDWLKQLWEALYEAPELFSTIAPSWGSLCHSKELAGAWAGLIREQLGPELSSPPLCTAYLSSLSQSKNYEEILQTIERIREIDWQQYQIGVQAYQLKLEAQTKGADNSSGGASLTPLEIAERAVEFTKRFPGAASEPELARTCELLLINAGERQLAYQRYALKAAETHTFTAWFKTLRKRYPEVAPQKILEDLIAYAGSPGKWFVAAKDAELYQEALELARSAPTDPRTLLRVAQDYVERNPSFSMESGILALTWMQRGEGYGIRTVQVWAAYNTTLQAATRINQRTQAFERLQNLVKEHPATLKSRGGVVTRTLSRELGLS